MIVVPKLLCIPDIPFQNATRQSSMRRRSEEANGREAQFVASRAKIGGKSLERGSFFGSMSLFAVNSGRCNYDYRRDSLARQVVKNK